ncbi:MAG: hypothetical protein EOO89_28400, partial [Pedobacter sp.]
MSDSLTSPYGNTISITVTSTYLKWKKRKPMMLNLYQNQSNDVVVTLYEKCSNLTNPYFTWVISNKQSKTDTVFTANDVSNVPYYYSEFTIQVVGITQSSGLTAGIINCPVGQYNYSIYEMSSPYDLDITNSINLVETGILN